MSALIHIRVLFAMFIREMITRYGGSFGGYAWAIVEPVGWIMLLSIVFSALVRNPPLGENFPFFFATGFLTYHMYRSMADIISRSIAQNKPLFNFPRVLIIHAVLARYFLQIGTNFAVLLLCYLGIILYFDLNVHVDFVPIIIANLSASLLGLGVGTVNCVLFRLSRTWERIFQIITRPLFLISGVVFIPEKLPVQIQEYIYLNPLVHLVGLNRSGFYSGYNAPYVDLPFVLGIALALFVIGLVLVRILRGRILEL